MTYRTSPGYEEPYGSESGYEESYEAEPDARDYINTVKSVFLAILKLITGLVGLGLIILIIVGLSGLVEAIHKGLNEAAVSSSELRDLVRQIPWNDFSTGTGIVTILTMVVFISLLLSMAMNGIGAFLLRVAKHGATPVQIAHIVYTVFGIIRFVLWCVVGTILIIGLFAAGAFGGNLVDIKQVFSEYGASATMAAIYLPSMIVLTFMLLIGKFLYHLSVSKVMSHTRKELSQGRIIPLSFYNKLPGRCIFLVVVYGIMFTLNAVLCIVGGSSTNSMGGAAAVIGILAVPLLLHYLRLFLVMGCAKDFDRAHY